MDELLSLKWTNHSISYLDCLSNLRKKELYSDMTLACEGKFYKVHKMVLSACSDYFCNMFLSIHEYRSPLIVLKDIRSNDLESLLDYMYLGEVKVRQSALPSLIKAAVSLHIKGLAIPDDEDIERHSVPIDNSFVYDKTVQGPIKRSLPEMPNISFKKAATQSNKCFSQPVTIYYNESDMIEEEKLLDDDIKEEHYTEGDQEEKDVLNTGSSEHQENVSDIYGESYSGSSLSMSEWQGQKPEFSGMPLEDNSFENTGSEIIMPKFPPLTHMLTPIPRRPGGILARRRCTACYESLSRLKSREEARKRSKQVSTQCLACRKAYCLNCFNIKHHTGILPT